MLAFHVCEYNLYQAVPQPTRFTGQLERALRVREVIQDLDRDHQLDAVAVCELSLPDSRQVVIDDMTVLGFPYHTREMKSPLVPVAGGVTVFSKHPIVQEENMPFGSQCTYTDCLAAKGIVYARIEKQSRFVNVFAVHFQAWNTTDTMLVRMKQVDLAREFMSSFQIPDHEPVLLVGDFNIDRYMNGPQLRHMTDTLGLTIPRQAADSHPFTVDPEQNMLAGSDDIGLYRTAEYPKGCETEYRQTLHCVCCPAEWIDFVSYSHTHLPPATSEMTAIAAKVPPFHIELTGGIDLPEATDVSDHFPVVGKFTFPASDLTKSVTRQVLRGQATPNHGTPLLVWLIIVGVTLGALLFLLLATWARRHVSRVFLSTDSDDTDGNRPRTAR